MAVEIEGGRLADAERLIMNLNENPRTAASDATILLGPIYCQQGRLEEAKRLIETRWDRLNKAGEGASEKAVNLLRLYTEIQARPLPVAARRAFLDQAALSSPDDDRIWLGKANLAIRAGAYDEASRWLDACLRRRPDDFAVWRAALERGLAANDVDGVGQALAHLPAAHATSAEVDRLAAWLAAWHGDTERERRALDRVIDVDPGDFKALDRLVELATHARQPDRADELRRKKTEIGRLQARYQKLHERFQPKRDAAEMAHLAGLLGRQFEAKALLALAVAANPNRDDLRLELARLDDRRETMRRTGPALADLLAPSSESTVSPPLR